MYPPTLASRECQRRKSPSLKCLNPPVIQLDMLGNGTWATHQRLCQMARALTHPTVIWAVASITTRTSFTGSHPTDMIYGEMVRRFGKMVHILGTLWFERPRHSSIDPRPPVTHFSFIGRLIGLITLSKAQTNGVATMRMPSSPTPKQIRSIRFLHG